MPYCSNCGNKVDDTAYFCFSCGSPISTVNSDPAGLFQPNNWDFPFISSKKNEDNTFKYGLVDYKNNEVHPPIFDSIKPLDFKEKTFQIETDGFEGVMDKKGKWIMEPRFRYCFQLHNKKEWFQVWDEGAWGICNSQGDWIIRPIYVRITLLPSKHNQPLFLVLSQNDCFEIIDFKENSIHKLSSEIITHSKSDESFEDFDEDFDEDLWNYYIDDKKNIDCGFFPAKIENNWGLLDSNFNWTYYPTTKNKINPIGEGFFAQEQNGVNTIINCYGKRIGNIQFEEVSDTIAADIPLFIMKWGDKWGCKDINGNVVVQNNYESIHQIAVTNRLIAKKNGKYGIIDYKGNSVTDFIYEDLNADHVEIDNLMVFEQGEFYGIIDCDGQIILKPQIFQITKYFDRTFQVNDYHTYGYIDSFANSILPMSFIYESVLYDYFSEYASFPPHIDESKLNVFLKKFKIKENYKCLAFYHTGNFMISKGFAVVLIHNLPYLLIDTILNGAFKVCLEKHQLEDYFLDVHFDEVKVIGEVTTIEFYNQKKKQSETRLLQFGEDMNDDIYFFLSRFTNK